MTHVVAVLGAAGKTGSAVVRAAVARGLVVRGVLRPGRSRPAAWPEAVLPVEADLRRPDQLEQVLRGARAVYLIAPNLDPDEPALVRGVLAAAARAGVEHVVYHSVAQPGARAMPHHLDKGEAEDLVRRSGSRWTVLQPCAYVQNLLGSLARDPPRLALPYSADRAHALVDLLDVAEVAAEVLAAGERHHGAGYELGGPLVTLHEVAAVAAQVLGRPVAVSRPTVQEWLAEHGAGLDAFGTSRLAAMFDAYDRWGFPVGSLVLGALLGRPPRRVEEVLRREAGSVAR